MKKHTKVYMDFFDIDYDVASGYYDYIKCEMCDNTAVDIHHIKFKSQGGKDNIDNLIALCRDCHEKAHSGEIPKFKLEINHVLKVCKYSY